MRTPHILISTLFALQTAWGGAALAQQGTPLPPPPGMSAAPLGATDAPADAGPALPGPELPAGAVADGRVCKQTVMVDGIPHTWDKLERDTPDAWQEYSNGQFTSSVPVFEKLAKIGHPVAQRLMGIVYFFGQGVPQDYRTALGWFEKAALQGCFEAYVPVAQMYEKGMGAPADLGQAYMWYNIAVGRLPLGQDRRDMEKAREAIAAQMTPAQIEAAQKRSLQFEPKPVVPPDISELPEDFFKRR